MKNVIITENNNHYLYHWENNEVRYIHPLIVHFSAMENNGEDPRVWLSGQANPEVDIDKIGKCTRKELVFYYKKYLIYKEKGFFHPVKIENRFERRLSGLDIENLITGSKGVSFGITENCNLDCHYCIRGDFYRIFDNHGKTTIDPEKTKRLLNYLSEYWRRPLSRKRIGIKFFGGEPLLNIDIIKEIVAYSKTLTGISQRFYYYITTNGILLNQYLDYLIANDFYIAVSLDGDKENNSFRTFANGQPSFEKVTSNINHIRDNYPSYFKDHISFQSVIHCRNSISDILRYFKKNYGKRPLMSSLTRVGLNPEKKEEFAEIYVDLYRNLYHGEDSHLLRENTLKEIPQAPGRGLLTHNIYNWLFNNHGKAGKSAKNKTPTGTCHPFGKGIFMAADGRILPCERIEYKYALGHIDNEVILDFNAIASRFNRYYDKISRLCRSCAYAVSCEKCMFYCHLDLPRQECNQYCDKKEYLIKLAGDLGYLEDNPDIYYKHLSEI